MKIWKGILLSIVATGLTLAFYFLFRYKPGKPFIAEKETDGLIEMPWMPLTQLDSMPGMEYPTLDSFNIPPLKTGDSVTVVWVSKGCFHFEVEKQIIKREEKGFAVSLASTNAYNTKLSGIKEYFELDYDRYMAPAIQQLQDAFLKVANRPPDKGVSASSNEIDDNGYMTGPPEDAPFTGSTSYANIYVIANNKVWSLNGIDVSWKPYTRFRNSTTLVGGPVFPPPEEDNL